ncbi:MAG: hypothetical protein WAW91_01040 [Candidatus Nanoperiomorbaceae bacterium]
MTTQENPMTTQTSTWQTTVTIQWAADDPHVIADHLRRELADHNPSVTLDPDRGETVVDMEIVSGSAAGSVRDATSLVALSLLGTGIRTPDLQAAGAMRLWRNLTVDTRSGE